ncbi:hypothetical protein E8E11_010711 [Didymella keratinophila]|nr:hypothetical protein E8E11_010711 [Didymella keratinophila]
MWDYKDVFTRGFCLNIERSNKSNQKVTGMPFESLAINVENPPEGDDTLCFTRCVREPVRNPGKYQFPQDFNRLIKITGGHVQVTLAHTDGEAVRRWKKPRTWPQVSNPIIIQQVQESSVQMTLQVAETHKHPTSEVQDDEDFRYTSGKYDVLPHA